VSDYFVTCVIYIYEILVVAILYEGAFPWLMTGLIGISALCSFSSAVSVGGDEFSCIRYLICFF